MVADSITIDKNNKVSFNNNVDYCIGTGRMGLALQREYFNQLKLVQEKIGFSHIRGHGLFSDDMAIYHEYKDSEGNYHAEYNFTYLDLVMDSYKELNSRFLNWVLCRRLWHPGHRQYFIGRETPHRLRVSRAGANL